MARVDAEQVVWVSPETLQREARERVVKAHRGDADALIRKLDEVAETPGEYRVVKKGEVVDGVAGQGVENGVVQVALEENRVVWVDDAPDDPQDPAGHFETYAESRHGESYHPTPSRRGSTPTEAPRVEDDS